MGTLVWDADCGFCAWSLRRLRQLGATCADSPWQRTDLDAVGLTVADVTEAAWFVDEHGGLHRGGRPRAPGLGHDVQLGRDLAGGHQRAGRLRQAVVDEHRRIDGADRDAQRLHGPVGQVARLVDHVGQPFRAVAEQLPHQGQPQGDRHHPGLRPVVQVAFDAAQFGRVRLQRLGAGDGEFLDAPG